MIIAGDLNSDVLTPPRPGDERAHAALLQAGFRPPSTPFARSRCITSCPNLAVGGGGQLAQFDRVTDHVMTNDTSRVRPLASYVTGRWPVKGFWSSDHAGVVSVVRLK